MSSHALLIDLYELTMAAGYLEQGKSGDTASFDLYFRHNPFRGGYAVAAGLEPALNSIERMRFQQEDLDYLRSLRGADGTPLFKDAFLAWLRDFRFGGSIRAVPEGTVVFPNEPLLQVRGNLIECQILESILLCHVNFQTLVATKAARMWEASKRGNIVEFGLRRAQGPDGALSACRGACIGGAESTSNVLAAAVLNVPARGTQAHSWIQAFHSELDAFRAYARSFPNDCVLLVDTYDVLQTGIPNAIQVARELEREGRSLAGIRLDSGDLAFLSREARRMLDDAGLPHVHIVASNELDEFNIAEIIAGGGRVDIWGIGTRLVTAAGEGGGALGGVYKMVVHNGRPRIKLSNNLEKMTTPGDKKIIRLCNDDGKMEADAVACEYEVLDRDPVLIIDPGNPLRRKDVEYAHREELLQEVMKGGERIMRSPSLAEICQRRRDQLSRLDETYRRLHNPHEYKVGLTAALWELKDRLIKEAQTGLRVPGGDRDRSGQ